MTHYSCEVRHRLPRKGLRSAGPQSSTMEDANASEIDPTASTSARLNREAFVGISAGAAAGIGTVARGLGQGAGLGKTHPPLVAPDDSAIVAAHVELRRPDGAIAAYAASPKNAGPDTPGIVVVMHIWGVDTSIRDVVRRYAKEGYVAIAPDLYSRFHAPSGDGVSDIATFRPFAKQLLDAQADADIRAAANWITAAHPGARVGVTGFCMGGAIALRQAITNGDVFVADAPFYGNPAGIDAGQIRIPICGSYGARDTSIPAESVRAFRDALRVPNDIVIYSTAGHAFFDDQRGAFDPAAAADAWRRTLAFFAKFLRG
ncbi:MAG TPA: dienelactone hydrolase family protein [Candidatus Baltobacteraceae bacterium]